MRTLPIRELTRTRRTSCTAYRHAPLIRQLAIASIPGLSSLAALSFIDGCDNGGAASSSNRATDPSAYGETIPDATASDGHTASKTGGHIEDGGASIDGTRNDGTGTDARNTRPNGADGSHDAGAGDHVIASSIRDGSSRADASTPGDGAGDEQTDASGTHDGGSETPELVYVGRFDLSDPVGPQMAWPGTRIVARFDGTAANAQLTQIDGYAGGPSWFNVIVDGVLGTPFSLEGTSKVISIASGLAPGAHIVELEKRTEANLGTVRFEGLTFAGGTGLLSPPPPVTRLIEFMSDSTIDGFGVLGDAATTCPTGDPPQYNDSRSSFAFFTANALGADMVLSAYSGKGLTVNESPGDTEYYEDLYPRAIPDSPASVWTFQTEIPDGVVISLGGVDLDGLSAAPPGFQAAYDSLVGTVRTHYPDAGIWLTVWSQITDDIVPMRTAMTNTLQAIVSARAAAGDAKIFLYVFPPDDGTDDTGCEGHADVAEEQAMAALMTTEIKQRLGW